jgi:hypothetical protein
MLAIPTDKNQFPAQILVHVISAALPVLFFFYVDEGYYSFAWMRVPGAWIVFIFYTFMYVGFQLLIKFLLPRYYSSWTRTTLSSLIGCFLLSALFLWMFSK